MTIRSLVQAISPLGPMAMTMSRTLAWPSGPPTSTVAAPVSRSTCQMALPTTLPASSRPCVSTARPCTPVKLLGATSTSGADQPPGAVSGGVVQALTMQATTPIKRVKARRTAVSGWTVAFDSTPWLQATGYGLAPGLVAAVCSSAPCAQVVPGRARAGSVVAQVAVTVVVRSGLFHSLCQLLGQRQYLLHKGRGRRRDRLVQCRQGQRAHVGRAAEAVGGALRQRQ